MNGRVIITKLLIQVGLECRGIQFNRATFFHRAVLRTVHGYIAATDATRKQHRRKLMDKMYVYVLWTQYLYSIT